MIRGPGDKIDLAIKIPRNFSVAREQLDANEQIIRDLLKLDVTNWAKFRYTIAVGNNANRLISKNQSSIPDDVKEAYRELAKSHYEVVTSLGAARVSYDLSVATIDNPLFLKKSTKDFYFHIGCLLDNLARLIYIVNAPNGASERYQDNRLVRHWIDWGRVCKKPWYRRLKKSRQLVEIINVRNTLVHGWAPPTKKEISTGTQYWPRAIRTSRDFFWPYDESKKLKKSYRKWIPIAQMISRDLGFIERFQNRVFAKLIKDIRSFEKRYNVVIR